MTSVPPASQSSQPFQTPHRHQAPHSPAVNNDILVVDLLSAVLLCYITYCLIIFLRATLHVLTDYNQWVLITLVLIGFCSHFIPQLFSLEYWNNKLFG